MHVPCLSPSVSEVHGKMQDFAFNLHGKNAELGVNSTCHSSGCFSLDEFDGRYSLESERAPLKVGEGKRKKEKKTHIMRKNRLKNIGLAAGVIVMAAAQGLNKSHSGSVSAVKLGHMSHRP